MDLVVTFVWVTQPNGTIQDKRDSKKSEEQGGDLRGLSLGHTFPVPLFINNSLSTEDTKREVKQAPS